MSKKDHFTVYLKVGNGRWDKNETIKGWEQRGWANEESEVGPAIKKYSEL